jgi:hypothetical protein
MICIYVEEELLDIEVIKIQSQVKDICQENALAYFYRNIGKLRQRLNELLSEYFELFAFLVLSYKTFKFNLFLWVIN